ncbi:aminoglycoside phosphotransferase, partial [Echria macrotheca]
PKARGFNNTNRVQSIVASQHLARRALLASDLLAVIVPAVYAWAPYRPDETDGVAGMGWIIEEFCYGVKLYHGVFNSLSIDAKKDAISQMADIFACVQSVKLPAGVTKFGGLTFDEHGHIADGQMPILPGGPWTTYAEVWRASIRTELEHSEEEGAVTAGWRANGVRDRIEEFIADGGVERMLSRVDVGQRVLVHGDFSMQNMLFSEKWNHITALLDFDFACVTHPCHEFFGGIYGSLVPRDHELLQEAVWSGVFDPALEGLSDEEKEMWEVAKAWDDELASLGLVRPSQTAGKDGLRDLNELLALLCPRILDYPMCMKRLSKGGVHGKTRAEIEAKIAETLDKNGVKIVEILEKWKADCHSP